MPWSKPAKLDLGLDAPPRSLASDAARQLLAVATERAVRVWTMDNWKVICEAAGADDIALSPDGQLVIAASREEVVARNVKTGQVLRSWSVATENKFAVHPSGQWIIAAGASSGLILLPMSPDTSNRFIRVGCIAQNSPEVAAHRHENVMCIGCSRNGRWLWCGTDRRLCVYEWIDLMGGDYRSAVPCRQYDSPECNEEYSYPLGYIYAASEEPEGNGILFGGISGVLRRIDPETGQVRELLRLQEHEAVLGLSLTPDGRTMGLISSAMGDPRVRQVAWQVWSYERLKQCDQPVVLG